jgi:hypothetical protein
MEEEKQQAGMTPEVIEQAFANSQRFKTKARS